MPHVNRSLDEFGDRIEALQAAGAAAHEIAAAEVVYERLLTAQAICQAIVPGPYSEPAMLALLKALCDEANAKRAS